MSFSNYLENALLDHCFGLTTYTGPTNTYVALGTDSPPNDTTFTEVTGNAYARVAVTNNTTNWPNASSGQKSNGAAVTFPTATPSGWGTVTCFAIYDNSPGGNQLGWGGLSVSKTVNAGDTPSFAIGALLITLD
jgi:hypothetical protein